MDDSLKKIITGPYTLPDLRTMISYTIEGEPTGPKVKGEPSYILDVTYKGETVRCHLTRINREDLMKLQSDDSKFAVRLAGHWSYFRNKQNP